jgi:hypothetical protein
MFIKCINRTQRESPHSGSHDSASFISFNFSSIRNQTNREYQTPFPDHISDPEFIHLLSNLDHPGLIFQFQLEL